MKNNNSLRDTIERFLDGELSESETDELWAELLSSPEDLEYMQTVATLKKMKRDGQLETSDKTLTGVYPIRAGEKSMRVLSGYRKYLVAASLLVIGLAVLFRVSIMPEFNGAFEPITMIEFEIERSGEEPDNFDRELQYAISHSVTGDLNSSLDRLNSIDKESLSEEDQFNLITVRGAIYFNMGLYEDAVAIFFEISEMDRLKPLELEKGLWYLANSQVQLNQYEEAVLNIEEVIQLDGAFSRPAKKLLTYIHSKESSEVIQE
jgi:tetratricopeptide (TPR) repeat protein